MQHLGLRLGGPSNAEVQYHNLLTTSTIRTCRVSLGLSMVPSHISRAECGRDHRVS